MSIIATPIPYHYVSPVHLEILKETRSETRTSDSNGMIFYYKRLILTARPPASRPGLLQSRGRDVLVRGEMEESKQKGRKGQSRNSCWSLGDCSSTAICSSSRTSSATVSPSPSQASEYASSTTPLAPGSPQ
ncbi:m19 protein [Murid betaherpesvirus 1]|uniref:M19 n=2 Tax=Murid herpesvirus 1 TaxID=10366 RepID=B3UXV0_MUHV1|nr:m19 [Muromegalovirus WP15B]ACE95528.1 m19 [Muromegalovirus C4A]AWV68620.1 m19 protein [Murid betaherpesvirus 1]